MDFDINVQNINTDLISFARLKPADSFQVPYNPKASGIKEDRAIYLYAYPKSDYPIIQIPYVIYDNSFDTLSPGFYEVALSDDEKFLLLLQSKEIKAKIPAVKVIHHDDEYKEAIGKIKEIDEKISNTDEKFDKKKLKKLKQQKDELEKGFELTSYAELKETNKGYFILEYSRNFTDATGYIPL